MPTCSMPAICGHLYAYAVFLADASGNLVFSSLEKTSDKSPLPRLACRRKFLTAQMFVLQHATFSKRRDERPKSVAWTSCIVWRLWMHKWTIHRDVLTRQLCTSCCISRQVYSGIWSTLKGLQVLFLGDTCMLMGCCSAGCRLVASMEGLHVVQTSEVPIPNGFTAPFVK